MITPENVKLKQNYILDITEIDWKEVDVTFSKLKTNSKLEI